MTHPSKVIVYQVTNIKNNKIYIGASIRDIKYTKYSHKFFSNKHNFYGMDKRPIYQAMKKHGFYNFMYNVMGEFQSKDEAYEFKEGCIAELNTMNPKYGYNCTTGSLYNYKVNKETSEKMSEGQINSDFVQTDEMKRSKSETMKNHWKNPTEKMLQDRYNQKHQIGSRDIRGKKNPMYGKGLKGKDNPMYGVRGEDHHSYGIPLTQEHKNKISKKNKIRAFERKHKKLDMLKGRTEKECIKCKKTKPLNMYGKREKRLDKLSSSCKECERKRSIIKYYKNISPNKNKTRNRYGHLIKNVIEGK